MSVEPRDREKTSGPPVSDWRWLFTHFRPLLPWQIASVVLVTAGSAASLVDPLILKWLIDTILPGRNVALLAVAAVLVFVSYEARTILGTFGSYCTFNASQRVILALRRELLAHMASLSADYHESTPVGAKNYLVQDLTQELGQISADVFPLILRTLVLSAMVGSAMVLLNRRLSVVVLPLALLFFFTIRKLRKRLRTTTDAVQGEASRTSSVLQEQLGSAVQIQLLQRERFQARRAFHMWTGLMRSEYRRKRAEIVYSLLSNSVIVAGVVAVLGYGGHQVMEGTLTVGGLVAFYSYLTRLFEPVYLAAEMNSRFQRIAAAVHRIRSFLDLKPSITDDPFPVRLPLTSLDSPCGWVSMKSVSFRYDGHRDLIRSFDLEIKPQQRIALVGASGSGKSTIAKLITRVYDTRAGSIQIDGVDVRKIQLQNLRSEVTYVPQRAEVFAGSIEENLRLGNPHTSMQELHQVADLVELGPILARAPSGWRQEIGPGGAKLSGGERQRLALGRVLLRRPRILVLDESTSELDPPAERVVLEKLNYALPETTIVVISHRLTALTWVDQIFVIECGSLIESGSHEDLYARGGPYQRLYDRQPAASGTQVLTPADPGYSLSA